MTFKPPPNFFSFDTSFFLFVPTPRRARAAPLFSRLPHQVDAPASSLRASAQVPPLLQVARAVRRLDDSPPGGVRVLPAALLPPLPDRHAPVELLGVHGRVRGVRGAGPQRGEVVGARLVRHRR